MPYFVKRADQVSGPYTKEQIKSGIQTGKLLETDRVSETKEGPWRVIAKAQKPQDSLPSAQVVQPATPQGQVVQNPTVQNPTVQNPAMEHSQAAANPFAKSGFSTPCRFRFTGTGGELFKELLISYVLLIITLGLYGAWFVCRFQKWYLQRIKLVSSNGKQVSFDFHGAGGEYFVQFLVGYLLTLITFGLYGPFFITNITKFFIDNTSGVTDDGRVVKLRFQGTGGELFGILIVGVLLTVITFGLYFPWFYCSLISWAASKTKINVQGQGAVQLGFRGQGAQLLGTFIVGYLLTVVTLGIYSFWFQVDLFKFLYGNTTVVGSNGQRYSANFTGTGSENLVISLKGIILCFLTLGIYMFWFIIDQTKFQLENVTVSQGGA